MMTIIQRLEAVERQVKIVAELEQEISSLREFVEQQLGKEPSEEDDEAEQEEAREVATYYVVQTNVLPAYRKTEPSCMILSEKGKWYPTDMDIDPENYAQFETREDALEEIKETKQPKNYSKLYVAERFRD